MTVAASAGPITDDFESYAVGSFPSATWLDMSIATNPPLPAPTGSVIQTNGRDGLPTRAFQVSLTSGSSQGLIAEIAPGRHHMVSADMRVDVHQPTPRFGNWEAAIGFFNDRGTPADINTEPQAVVYVYQQRWWFYAVSNPSRSSYNVQLSDVPVAAGDWFGVSFAIDALTGDAHVSIVDAAGVPNGETYALADGGHFHHGRDRSLRRTCL
jgi:hypothetical protein